MIVLLLMSCQPVTFVHEDDVVTAETCDGPTWAGFGEGFFTTWCQSCHSATTPYRAGAPDALDYDTYEQVVNGAASIRDAVLTRGSMPLGGGVYPYDLEQLEAFLDCPSEGEGGPAEIPTPDPDPTLDADGVIGVVDRVFAVGDAPEPYATRNQLIVWLEHTEQACPIQDRLNISSPWEGCTTSEGWYFSGLSAFTGDTESAGRASFELLGDFRLRDPDGLVYQTGGIAKAERGDGETQISITGTWYDWTYDGWLEDFSGTYEATVTPESITWLGGVGRNDEDIHLDVVITAECTDGVVAVRDVSGWHELELTCSCGPWSFEGEELGEVCLDLGDRIEPLATWLGLEP
ncbi:MAG: hypothetical protein GY913_06600 [Proteobacteria bacterium]|nr:hypothetical protein [Pseudomonadota bacterium]MCP4916575.1 hypothetical protein [Pseudomonadota bacterium]